MALDFAKLKASRAKTKDIMQQKAASVGQKEKSYEDARFWKPTVDKKTGNGSALIRFLPSADTEIPYVHYHSHFFQGPGGYYVQHCPTTETVGEKCPACENNKVLWATEDKAQRAIVSKRKRKLDYISNILVIKDPAKPENNGKVFLFKYGTKIHEKILKAMTPNLELEQPAKIENPFDLWEGANFIITIKRVSDYQNYDDSQFEDKIKPVGDDKFIKALCEQIYGINEFVDPKLFKSYEDLTRLLNKALDTKNSQTDDEDRPTRSAPKEKADTTKTPFDEDGDNDEDSPDEDEDPEIARFRNLANKG